MIDTEAPPLLVCPYVLPIPVGSSHHQPGEALQRPRGA